MVHRDGSLVGGKSSVLAVLRYESVVSCEILHIITVVACDHMHTEREGCYSSGSVVWVDKFAPVICLMDQIMEYDLLDIKHIVVSYWLAFSD